MTFEMAMMVNWLLVAAGLLASDAFSDLWSGSWFGGDDDTPEVILETGDQFSLTGGDDDYVGTQFGDTVFGQVGDDTMAGADGDDVLEGNTGSDFITGDAGDDRIAGGDGTDTLFGGDGDDVVSSDRLDADSNWARGTNEEPFGGDGDDVLLFSSEDVATGGAGQDTFGLVHTGQGAASITDFSTQDDTVTIYVDGLSEAAAPPDVSYEADTDTGQTAVSLDGTPALVFEGLFTAEDLVVTLEDTDQIAFGAPVT